MIAETEQWLLEGRCEICRKNKYCSKRCGANVKSYRKALTALINRKTGLGKIKAAMRQKIEAMEGMEVEL